jgi:hemin uptake protein HemP
MSHIATLAGGLMNRAAADVLFDRVSSPKSPNQTSSLDSTELLKGQKVIEIKHNGAVYRLQATKLGKLILTK